MAPGTDPRESHGALGGDDMWPIPPEAPLSEPIAPKSAPGSETPPPGLSLMAPPAAPPGPA